MKDQDLDHFLQSYSEQEPRPGIEIRVLNRVRARQRSRVVPWILVPVSGCIGIMIAIWMDQPQRVPPPAIAVLVNPPPKTVVAPQVRIEKVRHRVRSQLVPILRITPEERALVELAIRNPDQLRESLDELEKRASEPNEIVALRIEPLETNP